MRRDMRTDMRPHAAVELGLKVFSGHVNTVFCPPSIDLVPGTVSAEIEGRNGSMASQIQRAYEVSTGFLPVCGEDLR